jgi:membrane protease subunit HflC
MRTAVIVLAIIILLGIFGPQTLYTVDETQLVVVTRFGQIRDIHLDPGLKVKAPFIDSANRFDKRVLRVDVLPSRFPDRDNEFLDIDAYVRYRIIHKVDGVKTKGGVRKFFEKLGNLESAEDRIGRIVISALREEVAQREKEEIIGAIVGKVVTDEETGEVTREVTATNTRQDILDKVRAASDAAVKSPENDFGVEILDVRIKRADFPEAAQQSIFSRMRSEREVISRELRAQGQEERDTIEADANRQRTIILAEAERDAARLRGDGEAQAILIFAAALEQGPEFFEFQRSLEAYKKFLSTNSTIILSSEADLFRFLEDPAGRSNDVQP